MQVNRIYAIALRQLYLVKGSTARLLPMFAWVAIDIVLWGFITKYLNSVANSGFNFVPVMLGAILLWDFFTRVMQGVCMAFFEDVWARNFLNIFASPLSIYEYLIGLVVTSIATSTIGLATMLLLATLVFGLSFFSYGIMLVPLLMILFLFGIALGIIGTALVLRFGPAAEWLIWPIPALLSPFAAVFYPLATLPVWMQWISRIIAPSYVFESVRAIAHGDAVPVNSMVIGTALSVAYIILAAWFFTRVYRRAVRTGLIARYSAESLS